jgi:hypothetical protein
VQTLAKNKGKPRRPKMLFLLFPLLAIIFLMGWTLYMLGEEQAKQSNKKRTIAPPKKDNVHFLPNISSDEKEVIAE